MDVPFKSLQNVPPDDIHAFATSVLARARVCDALYLPCPQWQAAQVVDRLEQERNLPVIAYSHASFFVAFKSLGIADPIRGHGRLLASLADRRHGYRKLRAARAFGPSR
jgi:maleate cis-trans isomerase